MSWNFLNTLSLKFCLPVGNPGDIYVTFLVDEGYNDHFLEVSQSLCHLGHLCQVVMYLAIVHHSLNRKEDRGCNLAEPLQHTLTDRDHTQRTFMDYRVNSLVINYMLNFDLNRKGKYYKFISETDRPLDI